MHLSRTAVVLLALSPPALAAPQSGEPLVLHVSPAGRDVWSGRSATPAADGKDGPFATPQRAIDAVAAYRRGGGDADATVWLHGGTYPLTTPLRIAPECTTTKARLLLAAAADGQPVLSGGKLVTGWQVGDRDGRPLWTAELGAASAACRELWVDGRRATLARHPDTGTLPVEAVPDADGEWTHGNFGFRFRAGDLDAAAVGADIVVMSRWVESHLPVVSVDAAQRTVRTQKRSVFRLDAGDPWYAEGALGFLDAAGEFCVDRSTGRLSYLPLPGEDPAKVVAVVASLSQLLQFAGEPTQDKFVDNVTCRGLAFQHAEWWFPADFKSDWPAADAGGFAQAAILVPAAISAIGARGCVFDDCDLGHLGGYALELGRGCVGNTVARCRLHDLGAGGIKIGETKIAADVRDAAGGNGVVDCDIGDGGHLFHSAVGIWIGQSAANELVHDAVHDFMYTGISIGWTWGYGPSAARAERVEGNHVHHIGRRSNGDGPWLADMAGIYTLGSQPGTVITGNWFHDIAARSYGGWGIYFDEGTSQVVAEHNVVARTTHGGFHQHYGKDNVFRDNVLVDGRDAQIQRTRQEEHVSFTFRHNVVAWQQGALFAGDVRAPHCEFADNLYWRSDGGDVRFGDRTFADWQALGMDRASRIAPPQFVDATHDDYRLAPESPARALGMDSVDVRGAGPRPR
jgi:hypothetical protein